MYGIKGDFKRRKDSTFGTMELTVDGVIDLLQKISEDGHGDKILRVTYDSGYVATYINQNFDYTDDTVFLEGD